MPKISEAAGPTDEGRPGYYDLGRSEQSPKVTSTPEHPSERAYTDAMERHGTDQFTEADQATVDAWHADRDRREAEKVDENEPAGPETPGPKAAPGSGKETTSPAPVKRTAVPSRGK